MTIGGVIQRLQLKNSRKGDRYATFTLEDKTGTVEVICWPETYRKAEIDFTTDEPVCVSGTLEVGEERCQIIADEVVLLADRRARSDPGGAPGPASPTGSTDELFAPPQGHPRPAPRRLPVPTSTCCCRTGPRRSSPCRASCASPPPRA